MAQNLLDTTKTINFWGANQSSEYTTATRANCLLFDNTQNAIRYKPATDSYILPARDTKVFFGEVMNLELYKDFEINLHSFYDDHKGNPLVIGWTTLFKFNKIVSVILPDDPIVAATLKRIADMINRWPKDIDIVCFEGKDNVPKRIMVESLCPVGLYDKFLLAHALRLKDNTPRWIADEVGVTRGQVRIWEDFIPAIEALPLMDSLLADFMSNKQQ